MRPAVCLIVALLGLAGCTATQPTRAELARAMADNATLALRETLDGEALHRHVRDRTAVLLDGPNWRLAADDGGDIYLVKAGDESAGAAVVLTGDGYMLTAAHCVTSGRTLAFVPDPDGVGGFVPAGVRVVWTGDAESSRGDFAVLKLEPLDLDRSAEPVRLTKARDDGFVPCRLPSPGGGDAALSQSTALPRAWFGLSALDARPERGRRVLFVGMQPGRSPLGFVLAASAGRTRRDLPGVGPLRQIEFAGPIRPGFSGGPAVDAAGRLLGIVHSLRVVRTGPVQFYRVRGTLPDANWLAALIDADRAARSGR